MTSIEQRVGNATKWSIFTELVVKIISPITTMVLARLLTPDEFGVVATVTMIVSFSDIFTDAGFQKYIIQHRFIDENDENLSICVAFWTNFALSLLIWSFIYFFSDQLAIVVGNPGKGKAIWIGALILPLTSFSSIQTAIFRKNLDFKSLSWIRIMIKLVPLLVVAPLAYLGISYWALIIGNIVSEMVNALVLTIKSPWKPKLLYSFCKLKEMLSFCLWSMGESFSSWLVSNIGIFIIGTTFNEYYLGIYKTGTTTVNQILSIISASTISVFLSALSRTQDNLPKFRNIYFSFLKGIGIIAIPLGIGIFLYRDFLCNILLGSKWADASLIIGIWGFVLAWGIIFNGMSGAVILSLGKPKNLFYTNVTQAVLMIPAFYFGGKLGFDIMVVITTICRIELLAIQTYIACKESDIRFSDICRVILKYVIASIVMTLFYFLVIKENNSLIFVVLSILLCATVYFAVVCCFPTGRNELRMYFNIFTKGRKHFRTIEK